MMAIYFFHIRVGNTVIPDEEGCDLPDFEAVKKEATLSAHDLRREAAFNKSFPKTFFSIEIRDEAGNQVLSQPIAFVNGLSAH